MAQYSQLTTQKFHKYLSENHIKLRLSDMDEILADADAAMEKDIQRGLLNEKSETLLYQYAYEPAILKHEEVKEIRARYATQYGKWNGVDRRRHHHHIADN
jgi:hypothetical protein